jgi:hypothetical protein
MGTRAADAQEQNARAAEPPLSPERRVDAIADILARGLARALLAEDTDVAGDDAQVAQPSGNTSESALIDVPSGALMVMRGDDRAAAKGGRTR